MKTRIHPLCLLQKPITPGRIAEQSDLPAEPTPQEHKVILILQPIELGSFFGHQSQPKSIDAFFASAGKNESIQLYS
jgi:hypothetical protein